MMNVSCLLFCLWVYGVYVKIYNFLIEFQGYISTKKIPSINSFPYESHFRCWCSAARFCLAIKVIDQFLSAYSTHLTLDNDAPRFKNFLINYLH